MTATVHATPAKVVVPLPEDLEDHMRALLDLKARAFQLPAAEVPTSPDVVWAIYATTADVFSAAVSVDMSLALAAAKALARMPPIDFDAAPHPHDVTGDVLDALTETMSVLSGLLSPSAGAHVRLRRLHIPPDTPPADVAAFLARTEPARTYRVRVPRFGSGLLTLHLPAST